jgi:glutaminase
VPIPADSQYVDERLETLYRSHLLVGEDSVASYYESGRGYYEPELAAEERDRFSICIVRTNGEAHQAGDHDRPFALQSISKVFVYGLALADHGGGYVLKHVGVEPSGDAFNSTPGRS